MSVFLLTTLKLVPVVKKPEGEGLLNMHDKLELKVLTILVLEFFVRILKLLLECIHLDVAIQWKKMISTTKYRR